MPQVEIDMSRLSGFPLDGIPPCLRLHAGGSDYLSSMMVIIPRVQLGGIQHQLTEPERQLDVE